MLLVVIGISSGILVGTGVCMWSSELEDTLDDTADNAEADEQYGYDNDKQES